MKHNHTQMMPLYPFRLTRSLQASACALAQLLLLVFTPWLHAHLDEDHGTTAGHAYHVHTVAATGEASPGEASPAPADDYGHEDGVALTPEEAFVHLLGADAPLATSQPSPWGAHRSPVAGDLPPLAYTDEVQRPLPLLPDLSPRLSTPPGSNLSPGKRILLLGTDLPPPTA